MKSAVRRVLLLSALASPTALYALGLGEIRLNSALNQPFDAEIELVSATPDDLATLRASIASSDAFQRYGLDKPAYLSDFTFRLVSSGGRDVLRVTSPRPVTEPFVTLLVEASWPRGHLLREYTVLLDPPTFEPQPAVATPAPRSAAVQEQGMVSAPASEAPPARAATPAPAPAPRRVAAAPAPTAIAPGSTYHVQSNDTLWEIARDAHPGPRAEVNRAMVAIYQANPSAFGGNINVLRAGSELRIPTDGEVASISSAAAAEEVARQYRLWSEGVTEAPGAAPEAGRLRLVAPEQGGATPSTAATATPVATGTTADLQARVQQLEAELTEARRLLELRNDELAKLQGRPDAATAPGAAGEAAAADDAAADDVAATTASEAAPPQPDPEEAAAPAESPAAAATEPQAEAAVPAKPTKPRAEPAQPEPSFFDRVRDYWWVLAGLLAAALGIAVFLRSRREAGAAESDLEEALRRQSAEDLRAKAAVAVRPKEAAIVVEERQPVELTAVKAAPAVALATAAAAATRAEPLPAEPPRRAVSLDDTLSGEDAMALDAGDPLAEADFHMAYGLYDQAADLVQVALKREPDRRDLKLKLLEIYFVWGNRERFLELARELRGKRAGAAAGEWDKVLIMGKQLAADDPLFAGESKPEPGELDMELHGGERTPDFDLSTSVFPAASIDLTVRELKGGGTGGLDFLIDEPVRGVDADESALAPTIESPRVRSTIEEPTAEVPIEDLGLDLEGAKELDELSRTDLRPLDLTGTERTRAAIEDTVAQAALSGQADVPEQDLLSATSILHGDFQKVFEEATTSLDTGQVGADTGTLPSMAASIDSIDSLDIEATGELERTEITLDVEPTTMSEVGTKLDLARAYIDMGDPEGARSILDEVLKEGTAAQKQAAERLIVGLP